jgi:transcription elongation factor Elf1
MNITCPYCHSENVSRETAHSGSANSFSSMAGAGIGASLAKSFPSPFSPILGGLAGAVIGGLLDSIIQPPKPQQSMAFFHCHSCQQNFN